MKSTKVIKPGGVIQYITQAPKDLQSPLRAMREAIRAVVPDAIETVSYFDMPGYAYEGYAYNGMFAWFSYKGAVIRLHVRPQALIDHKAALAKHATTRAIVNFRADAVLPTALIKKLVRASLKDMKKTA